MKRALPEISMAYLQQKLAGEDLPHKKKSAKDQLKETQEELRCEQEAREKLEKEKTNWTKERNFWITELKKMEEVRRVETRFSEVLRDEEVRKLNEEKELEQQKLLMDLEDMRKQCDDLERQKLEIEASWREATESCVQKISRLMDTLEEKMEEIEKLRITVEELQKEAEIMEPKTETNLNGEDKKGKKSVNILQKWKRWYSSFMISRKSLNKAMGSSVSMSLESAEFQAYTGL